MERCLTSEVIAAYAAGVLETKRLQDVESHLQACERCRRAMEAHTRSARRTGGIRHEYQSETLTQPNTAGEDEPEADRRRSVSHPDRIGPYRVHETLGEGGMGTVYLAEQDKPVRRRVALKIIKLGMDTREVVSRFESERQALALMNHPNVAAVYEAGATEQGRPYFVMEYVPGVPITDYCDRHRLTMPERLDLFTRVCEAIQHAHQKGIIHRDIKPSNILVSVQNDKPVPKVIDFGVAKAINQRLTEHTVYTEQGRLIGTPEYMSPEQAEMTSLDVDTRTDVYSLGVVLYKLLVGALPFDPKSLREAGYAEIQRIIREVEPPKPSTRLSTLGEDSTNISSHRRTDLRALHRELQGDLDWITMKAMDKDRTRRYASAAELSADITRHLSYEPVTAGPPSTGYRLRKFVRRNRGVVAATATVIVVLLVATIGMSVLAGWALRERERAEREANRARLAEAEQSRAREEAEQSREAEAEQRKLAEERERETAEARDQLQMVVDFQSSTLSEIDAEEMGRGLLVDLRDGIRQALKARNEEQVRVDTAIASFDKSVRGVNATNVALRVVDEYVLTPAVEAIEQDFADQPLVRAALQQTVADTYSEIGLFPPALPLQEAALETRRRKLGNEHPKTLTSLDSMGVLLCAMARYAEAERYQLEALEGRRRALGEDHPDTLTSMCNMGVLLWKTGRGPEAERYHREALERRHRVLGDDHSDTLTSVNDLGVLLWWMGKYAEAEPYYREALEGYRRVLGDDHPKTLTSLDNMGVLLCSMARYADAEKYQLEALEGRRRTLGEDHPDTLRSMCDMGVLLWKMGRGPEAERYHREALERRRRVLGEDHSDTLTSVNDLGVLLWSMGKHAEAEPYYREALEGYRRVLGEDHPDTLTAISNIAVLLWSMNRPAESEKYHREAQNGYRRVLGDDHPLTLNSINALGLLFRDTGRYAEAEQYFREALEGRRRVLSNDHPDTLTSMSNLGFVCFRQGHYEEALRYCREQVAIRRRVLGNDHPDTLISIINTGRALRSMGRIEEAEPYYREALEIRRRVLDNHHPDVLASIVDLGWVLKLQGSYGEAEPLLREGLDGRTQVLGRDHPDTLISINDLGRLLLETGEYVESEQLLLEAAEGLAGLPPAHVLQSAIPANFVELYSAWHAVEPDKGYDTKAAEWRAKAERASHSSTNSNGHEKEAQLTAPSDDRQPEP